MRVPLSWLREYAALPGAPVRDIAAKLIAAGLEVESVTAAGADIRGVTIGEVLAIEELSGFKKPIRYCQVATGQARPHGIICGAVNFAVGDRVAVALPGAVLPGGFEIGQRKAYGRGSDGMICSAAELGLWDDRAGIVVLERTAPIGADFADYADIRDKVLDIAVTPDRGYCISIRGVAREAAIAFDVEFTDPADTGLTPDWQAEGGGVHAAAIDDPIACDRFVLREVSGLHPAWVTPIKMRTRLARAGMRPVALAVDITNYLMLELGQPLHAFDKTKLSGPLVVRRARPGEVLETLDHVVRQLHPEDIVIADSSGAISLAGTMGGLDTEIGETSTEIVIEAAHFSAVGIARQSRRHRLGSEASYRFERGVDRELPMRASAKAVAMLADLGAARVVPGCTHAQVPVPPVRIAMAASHPDRVAGMTYGRAVVERRLRQIGCAVHPGEGTDILDVHPPSWRLDLEGPNDLAEEVIRLEGYENIPVRLPRAPAGGGLTQAQRTRRAVSRAFGGSGYVEVLSFPFSSAADFDALQLADDDPRRRAVRLANPLSDDEPLMRTTLLPGLLRTLVRNLGRGFGDLALYEMGLVYLPRPAQPGAVVRAPRLRVDRGPTGSELAVLDNALPRQPLHAAVVLAGNRWPAGWWGPGEAAVWADAVQAARDVAAAANVALTERAAQYLPWHPGRCAELVVIAGDGSEQQAGFAGELHPRVVAAFGLPPRSCAMEIDLSLLESAAAGPAQAPRLSTYPVATQDVALVVARSVPATRVADALRAGIAASGAADLLEEIRLFDVYTGAQAGEGKKSLAYTLRLRAPDHTLTASEAAAVRDAAVAEAARLFGAVLRGS
jgi:phenylalanyl-tRNA synthetase beta chain